MREYWVSARSVKWDIAPTRRGRLDEAPVRGRTKFRAFVYQLFSPGFAHPLGRATMPGPTLEAEVGDAIVVHLRNADERFGQAITMHPHGVRYTPDYDGSYLGDYTRAGGFIAPGEEFNYTWECTPDSVGVWPYHDHGPNAHDQHDARPVRRDRRSARRASERPDVEEVLFLHSFAPPGDRPARQLPVHQRPRVAPATRRRSARRSARTSRCTRSGCDSFFHTFHVHGHRWRRTPTGALRGLPDRRTERDGYRPLDRGQPRTLALPLPRLLPPGLRHGRLVPGRPHPEERETPR